MNNELIFFVQIITIMGALVGTLFLGKEALVALICLYGVLANFFVVKQVTLFGLSVTASDAYMIGSILGLNIIHEHFGYVSAKRTIVISFLLSSLYLVVGQLHLWFMPHPSDVTQGHFIALLTRMPRVISASIATYLFVQILSQVLYAYARKRLPGWIVVANISTVVMVQILDTILFTFLGLYGMVTSVGHIIVFSLLIKGCIIALSIPFVALTRKVVQIK
jgi:uncharacterized integral membrane protein (TIGR00697 family)